jgi:hypothetical protein
VSDWNAYLDRKAELDLSLAADRLADAIARHTLGWNARSNEVGRKLLRDYAGLHGRSFERALAELVNAGLVKFTPGSLGRGHRARYELLLDGETAAPERPFSPEKAAQKAAQKAAPERPRREKGERKNTLTLADDAEASPRETVCDERTVAAVRDLTALLDDADDKTELTLLRNFGDLPPAFFAYVASELARKRDYPENDAEYAYGMLAHLAAYGLPVDP